MIQPTLRLPIIRIIIAITLIVGLGIVIPGRVSAQTFNDVPTDYWAFPFIETLAASGITAGCGNDNFCPNAPVTRAQMAVFLERGIHGSEYSPPAATGTVFLDIAIDSFAASFIEQLLLDGITSGCGDEIYCPKYVVTRAQMAVFLLRAKYGAGYSPPPPFTPCFNDVGQGIFGSAWICQLAAEGVTAGCGNSNYCPHAPVKRDQMAVFLVRTFNLNSLDWLGRVPFPASPSILPEDWSLPVGEQVQFFHNLGEAPAALTDWTVNGISGGNNAVGTINAQGLYTAPAAIPVNNPVTVRAALSSNAAIFEESPVTVTAVPIETDMIWALWTPRVIDTSSSDGAVTLEAAFSGYPTLEFSLWDEMTREGIFDGPGRPITGTVPPPVAVRTGVYAWRMSVREVIADHTEGILVEIVGSLRCENCNVRPGTEQPSSIAMLYSDSTVPSVTVSQLGPNIQASSHVVNIQVDESEYDFASSFSVHMPVFYQHFSDSFDFVSFVRPVDHYLVDWAGARAGTIQNSIAGIGRGMFDNSEEWGSERLQLGIFSNHSHLAGHQLTLTHEIGHRWFAYLDGPPVQATAHFPPYANFSDGLNIGNPAARFDHVSENVYQINCNAEFVPPYLEYSDIELYLMGLVAPDEVGEHIVFEDPTTSNCGNQGAANVVTIEDIVQVYGARTPDHTQSQKNFSMATIVLSQDRLLSEIEMTHFNHMAERTERRELLPNVQLVVPPPPEYAPFFLATGGRATLSTRVLP